MSPEFFTLHSDLPRQGPGLPTDLRWAVERAGLTGAIRVIDAGCGPGADLVTLAEVLPEARITGIEAHAPFVAEATARIADLSPRVDARAGDMADLPECDLVWCAGAIYFLGIVPALRQWAGRLCPGGLVAFSEPCLIRDTPGARSFWQDYPGLGDLDGIRAQVSEAGYRMLDHRAIIGEAWEAYYTPLEARIADLRPGASAALSSVLDDGAREARLWRENREDIAYMLILATPDG